MTDEQPRRGLFKPAASDNTSGTNGSRVTRGSKGTSTRGTRGTSTRGTYTRGTATRGTRGTETRTSALGQTQRRKVAVQRFGRRAKAQLRRGTEAVTQSVSLLGWFVLALTLTCLVLGLTSAWVEAWFIAIAGGLAIVIALPFLLGNRSYNVGIEIDRTQVVAGGEVRVRLRITNESARPAMPSVAELPVGPALREITIPFVGPGAELVLDLTIPTPMRGVIAVGPLTIARQDPIGLVRREVTWPEKHLVHVHPETALLPPHTAGLVRDLEGAASRRLTDSDLSFYAVREYAPGDAMRHVHWKSTAKTGTLMVRQYEESQTARVAVLFDARREEYLNDEEFELGVSVAASLSLQAVREGRERYVASAWAPGRLRPSIDGLEELPSRDPAELLNSWAELEHAPEGLPFEALARGLAHSPRPLSIVVLVTGSVPDQHRIRRAAVMFAPDVHVLAVSCRLHQEPRAQRVDPLTLFTVGALGDLPQLMIRSGL